MAEIQIFDMATNASPTDSDFFEQDITDTSLPAGRNNKKISLGSVADFVAKTHQFSADLQTTSKSLTGAINEVKHLADLIPQFSVEVVQELPTEDISDTTLYLVPATDPQLGNAYEEYIHVNNTWELVGSTAVDLSAYYTSSEVDTLLAAKANAADVTTALSGKEDKSAMSADVRAIYSDMTAAKSATITDGIAHFTTIEESALKSLKADLTPIQNLNGYDRPWAGGAGKNKLDVDINSYTTSGITANISNGVITTSGTASAGVTINLKTSRINTSDIGELYKLVDDGSFTFSSDIYLNIRYYDSNGSALSNQSLTSGKTMNLTVPSNATTFMPMIIIKSGITANGTFKPMLMLKTESDNSFAPYSNECPIYGHTQEKISVSGKNKLQNSMTSATVSGITFTVNTDGTVQVSGTATAEAVRVASFSLKAGSYIFTTDVTETLQTYDSYITKSGSTIARGIEGYNTFTLSEDSELLLGIRVRNGQTVNLTYKPMLRLSFETDATFEPYNPDSYEVIIALGGTCYGGNLDVKNGVLTVDRAIVDLGDLNWTFNSANNYFSSNALSDAKPPATQDDLPNAICEIYGVDTPRRIYNNTASDGSFSLRHSTGAVWVYDTRYTDATTFKTAMSGVQLCYELATPTTIQLTPTEIKALAGDNNVSASTGAVSECKYTELGKELPDVTSADEGKVLTVNSSGKWVADRTPPEGAINYSTLEQDTGIKWVDGSEIYQITKVVSFTSGATILDVPFVENAYCLGYDGVWVQHETTGEYYHPFNCGANSNASFMTISTAQGYGQVSSTGIRFQRSNGQAYGDAPTVYLTYRYIKMTT